MKKTYAEATVGEERKEQGKRQDKASEEIKDTEISFQGKLEEINKKFEQRMKEKEENFGRMIVQQSVETSEQIGDHDGQPTYITGETGREDELENIKTDE